MKSVKPKLYYFIGYPGAGKTTMANLIVDNSQAVHIWADNERHKMFDSATHSQSESQTLYERLNDRAESLLSKGKSVVFDTNFNFYGDRQLMRDMAERQNAEAVLIWMDAPLEISKQRSVCSETNRNGYTVSMSSQQFDIIASKLEPPRPPEDYIRIASTNIDQSAALMRLGLANH